METPIMAQVRYIFFLMLAYTAQVGIEIWRLETFLLFLATSVQPQQKVLPVLHPIH